MAFTKPSNFSNFSLDKLVKLKIKWAHLLSYGRLRLAMFRGCILYVGDIPRNPKYANCFGLSLSQNNVNHIRHDITNRIPLPDSSVLTVQSEDVFEHIEPNLLVEVINDIHRILKPGGLFRLSMPDYRCEFLRERAIKDKRGEILFDPGGGGEMLAGKVVKGGHVWFPVYESVQELLAQTEFKSFSYLHYYDKHGTPVLHDIDYMLGYVQRTPDNDPRGLNPRRPISIVVDCRKSLY